MCEEVADIYWNTKSNQDFSKYSYRIVVAKGCEGWIDPAEQQQSQQLAIIRMKNESN